jgi:hypothetical protein
MKLSKIRRQRGFGLLETAVAMVVILAIAGGGLAFYSSNRHAETGVRLYEEFMDLKRGVQSLYANKSGYEGLTEQTLYDAGVISPEMARGDGRFHHSEGHLIQIHSTVAGCTAYPGCHGGYGVKMFALRPEVCKTLARQDYGDNVYTYWIGLDYHYPPFDQDALVASCDTGDASFRVFFQR